MGATSRKLSEDTLLVTLLSSQQSATALHAFYTSYDKINKIQTPHTVTLDSDPRSCFIVAKSGVICPSVTFSSLIGVTSCSRRTAGLLTLKHLPRVLRYSQLTEDDSNTTNTPNTIKTALQPLGIRLNPLHLQSPLSKLENEVGSIISLPATTSSPAKEVLVIVDDTTSHCLMLESYYDAYILNRDFIDTKNRSYKSTVAQHGFSRCTFSSSLGLLQGESDLNDRTAPKFRVGGVSHVPIQIQSHTFSPTFFLLDHLFVRREFESKFVAVLGLNFLRKHFILTQWTPHGYIPRLPPTTPVGMDEIVIYTDGCCLGNGQAGSVAQAGYGIHFPKLPLGWDVGSPLSLTEKPTNQRAELTAVVRALQLVNVRGLKVKRVRIFTDSNYAVMGLNEWIPRWRVKGYHTAKKKPVVNADLFKDMDREVLALGNSGILVTLGHVPREENRAADFLSKAGATSAGHRKIVKTEDVRRYATSGIKTSSSKDEPVVALSESPEDMKPLIQWTPDGEYWTTARAIEDSSAITPYPDLN